jgi:hypothetical protein
MRENAELVKAIRMAVVMWNTRGPRKVGDDVSQFIADFLIENRVATSAGVGTEAGDE